MTSQINPQNIDGAYPVAGQDNDSQGFRDNFTNTKTNFVYAAAEITDLQNKAVLKAPLTGTTLNNDMGGSILSNAQLQDIAETAVVLPTTGGLTLNYVLGPYFTCSTSGSVSIAFSNWPASGTAGRIRLRITVNNTAHTLTIPSSVNMGTNNIQNLISNVIYFATTGTYEFEFETTNAGTDILIIDKNRNLDPIYLPSSEDLADGATINVAVTTSYFTTGGAETATLPAAPVGLVKVLYARNVAAGNMVITASGPAWGGAGTITFANTGDACTLLSTGGGWVCIGNNGAVFA